LGPHPEEDAEVVEEGRKTTPPSSSSTSRVLGFSDPGFQNLDMAAHADAWRLARLAVGEVGSANGERLSIQSSGVCNVERKRAAQLPHRSGL
jgi:hypothetical protein